MGGANGACSLLRDVRCSKEKAGAKGFFAMFHVEFVVMDVAATRCLSICFKINIKSPAPPPAAAEKKAGAPFNVFQLFFAFSRRSPLSPRRAVDEFMFLFLFLFRI